MPLQAYETLQIVREQLRMMEFASLPAIVRTAQTLTKAVDTMTNYELAMIICKDPFATAKVLDLANKGGAQRVTITKLEDAILAAGYQKVRGIAFGLLDMESAKAKLRHPEQEEAACIALCSCLLAEEIMNMIGNYDIQEAYIATSLRSYGRVLMSAFCIETYREAITIMGLKGEEQAFRAAFGLRPIDLTHELLIDSKLPKELVRTLKPIDPDLLEMDLVSLNKTQELMIFSDFCLTLTHLIFNFRVKAKDFQPKVEDLIELYQRRFSFSYERAYNAICMLDGAIRNMEARYGINPLPDVIVDTLSARINTEDPPKKFIGSNQFYNAGDRKPKSREEILRGALNSIMSTMARSNMSWSKIYEKLVESFMYAFDLDNCILFVDDEDDQRFVPVCGLGEMYKYVKKRVNITAGLKDICGACLEMECDGLIFDTRRRGLDLIVPSWMAADNVTSAFMFNVQGLDHPFIIVGMRNKREERLEIPGGLMKLLGEIRMQLLRSVKEEPSSKESVVNFRPFMEYVKAHDKTGKPVNISKK